jgi:hypothetical protein
MPIHLGKCLVAFSVVALAACSGGSPNDSGDSKKTTARPENPAPPMAKAPGVPTDKPMMTHPMGPSDAKCEALTSQAACVACCETAHPKGAEHMTAVQNDLVKCLMQPSATSEKCTQESDAACEADAICAGFDACQKTSDCGSKPDL